MYKDQTIAQASTTRLNIAELNARFQWWKHDQHTLLKLAKQYKQDIIVAQLEEKAMDYGHYCKPHCFAEFSEKIVVHVIKTWELSDQLVENVMAHLKRNENKNVEKAFLEAFRSLKIKDFERVYKKVTGISGECPHVSFPSNRGIKRRFQYI